MTKLFFRYGTCASGKTDALLGVYYTYIAQKKRVLLLKPKLDSRYENEKEVRSRSGKNAKADYIIESIEDVRRLTEMFQKEQIVMQSTPEEALQTTHCVLVDECQFVDEECIPIFKSWTLLGIPVICYGLRTTFKMKLFDASRALMEWADEITEIKSVCASPNCKSKSFMNLKFTNGKPVNPYTPLDKNEAIVDLGFEDKYMQICYKHLHKHFPIINDEYEDPRYETTKKRKRKD
jgi:thymidine kinase